jgi:[ribosomal protein S5]-alanine N-acetyltransferase
VRLVLDPCEVRSWRRADAAALARHADNRRVWLNLRDRFPHPYTLADAHAFLDLVATQDPETAFAISVGNEAVGGIGVTLGTDVERCSAELGYWLGEAVWGRGIATSAVRAFSEHALAAFGLTRLYALPYARNAPSIRVLEKAGYLLEGRLRRSALKGGEVLDQLLYALVR